MTTLRGAGIYGGMAPEPVADPEGLTRSCEQAWAEQQAEDARAYERAREACDEDDDEDELTDEERRAIASLERLAKRWPQSLRLFSWSGTLCVIRSEADLLEEPEANVITTIEGIPNGGGAP